MLFSFFFFFFGRLVLVFGWFRLLCSGNNSISARVYFQPPRAVHFFFFFIPPHTIAPPFFSHFSHVLFSYMRASCLLRPTVFPTFCLFCHFSTHILPALLFVFVCLCCPARQLVARMLHAALQDSIEARTPAPGHWSSFIKVKC